MKILLVDLYQQYLSIKEEIDSAIQQVISKSAFIQGEAVIKFEEEFAAYCGVNACVGVANGTDALILALKALGIGFGDEVITVAHTFFATGEAIFSAGATPVFVDVCPDTWLMSPEAVEAAITPHTRAIIPVHLYGNPCNMDRILDIAKQHRLKVIEDAAQAHGAKWRGKRMGSFGDVGCFSFYPGKNLGAYGDGGAVVSQDKDLIEYIRSLSNHGRHVKYSHAMVGYNSRLDGIQAAVLRVKLKYLDTWNAARRRHAASYLNVLSRIPNVRTLHILPEAEPIWHLFVIHVPLRDPIQTALRENNIETGIHYPLALHQQPAFKDKPFSRVRLPVTEDLADHILSLPMYAELETGDIEKICHIIAAQSN